MESDEKQLLQKTLELEKENNSILRSMQRAMRFQRIMNVLYWVFIIGSAVGAYYLIQPYIEAITGAYGGAKDSVSDNFGDFFDSFK